MVSIQLKVHWPKPNWAEEEIIIVVIIIFHTENINLLIPVFFLVLTFEKYFLKVMEGFLEFLYKRWGN